MVEYHCKGDCMKEKTCCFSGHRPKSFPWKNDESDPRCVWLKSRIYEEIARASDDGFTRFMAGGAQGVDMWAAEAVLEFKRKNKDREVTLSLVIPFLNYAGYFSNEEKARLIDIIEGSDERILTSNEDERGKSTLKYYRRNEYMVDNSSRLIAVYEEKPGGRGGTKYTVDYAKKSGIDVVIIHWKEELLKRKA